MSTQAPPRLIRWYLRYNRWWSRWLIQRRNPVALHATHHVPPTGAVVLAANHIGLLDGPILAIFSPRPTHALTKQEMFRGPGGAFLKLSGQIPLDRDHTDPRAVKTAVRALNEGLSVGIFPEGTRGAGDLETFHRGAAYLALATGAPVVPVFMFGTRDPGGSSSSLPSKGVPIDLVYGEPFHVAAQPWPRSQAAVAQTSRRMRAHMLAGLETACALVGRELPGPVPAEDEPKRTTP